MEPKRYSKDYPLTFPIVRKNKKKMNIYKSAVVFLVTVILLAIIISKTSHEKESSISIISALLFIFGLIIVIFINFFIQKFRFAGEFTITDRDIILKTTNKTATFRISELNNLKMYLNPVEYNPNPIMTLVFGALLWLFGKYDGTGNHVEFIDKGESYNIELYLHGKLQAELFRKRATELDALA